MQIISLTAILLSYLFLVFWEISKDNKQVSIATFCQKLQAIPLSKTYPYIFLLLITVAVLLIRKNSNLFFVYLYIIFSLTILMHGAWVTWNKKIQPALLLSILFCVVIVLRILFPNFVLHDIFIMLVVSWIGPVIASFRFFPTKIFVALSCCWFCYDVWYVWLTASYHTVHAATSATGFPLAVILPGISIGMADLLYASLLLASIKNVKFRIIAVIFLIVSNLLLLLFHTFSAFPLLVMWVPVGLGILLLEKVTLKRS